ncbi:uncharacterized protein LOC112055639 [Bicyclus anynana]|uniref:Uncharacterized protein LOC112055639 n=1 Tax=Bicyclus anynana TaxID=110368 RepID=A0A6J1P3S0_BICAN|nr:uncharacterized protein LOC112055639 [Bicyclus anynana]
MYAVAGTEKYVKADELDHDKCTQAWRRKVVYTCVPAIYNLEYGDVVKWSYDDVAVVKVEKPFIFDDRHWSECSYSPAPILVNFDVNFEKPGTNAIVMGWGHTSEWRSPNSTTDLNQSELRYASVSILDTEECKKSFTDPKMGQQIEDFMICTYHGGIIDEYGVIKSRKLNDGEIYENLNKTQVPYNTSNTVDRKQFTNIKVQQNYTDDSHRNWSEITEFRRKGICQNDHGGPLVTWINGTEHVIGVASVFRVDRQSHCVGPFLYTSTAKNKDFIQCILEDLVHTDRRSPRRRSMCEQPKNGKGFIILRRYIKWTTNYEKDSVASNLNIQLRPQISISNYRGK